MARQIQTEMHLWLKDKIAHDPIATEAIKLVKPRLYLARDASACVGIREVGGNNTGPMVKLVQQTIGRAEREAWCMAFVQTIIADTELVFGIKSLIYPSEHCLTVWHKTPHELRVVSIPLPGAIAIWQHGETTNGHTGILIEYNHETGYMYLIEGNTEKGLNPDGTIERDGGGVYFTKRHINGDGNMKLVGFLKPF